MTQTQSDLSTQHGEAADAANNAQWSHPKVTPFHLTFILITGVLGVAKAALVSQGETASSTTVEWVAGVVVALTLQFLGSYEFNETRPQYLDWFFNYDCVRRSHPATDAVSDVDSGPRSIQRRRLSIGHDDHKPLPLVTGYRLLSSGLLALFGLIKMFCGYLGLSSAMNTLDWVIALPLTLSLYYVGLYEEHKIGKFRRLFEVNYSREVIFTCNIVLRRLIPLALDGGWLFLYGRELYNSAAFAPLPAMKDHPVASEWPWTSHFWYALCFHSSNWSVALAYIACIDIGLLALAVILWPVIQQIGGHHIDSSAQYSYGFLFGVIALYILFPAAAFCNFVSLLCLPGGDWEPGRGYFWREYLTEALRWANSY